MSDLTPATLDGLRAKAIDATRGWPYTDAFHDAVKPSVILALLDAIKELTDVGTGKIPHRFMGGCPDRIDGFDRRDSECPACAALTTPTNPTKEQEA